MSTVPSETAWENPGLVTSPASRLYVLSPCATPSTRHAPHDITSRESRKHFRWAPQTWKERVGGREGGKVRKRGWGDRDKWG